MRRSSIIPTNVGHQSICTQTQWRPMFPNSLSHRSPAVYTRIHGPQSLIQFRHLVTGAQNPTTEEPMNRSLRATER